MIDGDADLVPLSALQHLMFCERQSALIHVEKIWIDNAYTVDGHHAHRRVDADAPRRERRGDTVILRGLWLRSERLGLIGRADAVEIHRADDDSSDTDGNEIPDAVAVEGLPGRWRFYPIEYKRGRPKRHRADEVQLCAQAMCIEEMNDVRIASGSLFYGRTQRRLEVQFDDQLRRLVEHAAMRMRRIIDDGITPAPHHDARCDQCSLAEACLPAGLQNRDHQPYLAGMIRDHLDEGEDSCDST